MSDNQIRRRAKANFPTVLLTLLSIVQALALELMWSHLGDQIYLHVWSFQAILGWSQLAVTLLGVLLIWLIYSDLVLRFAWVPRTIDAIFPFLVGILEFALISSLSPERIGLWFLLLATLFGAMTWMSQSTMKRARLDPDNKDFFNNVSPATLRDHLFSISPVLVLIAVGSIIWLTGDQGWFSLTAVYAAGVLLIYQIWMNHVFTQRAYLSV